jgi:hypothetical protein
VPSERCENGCGRRVSANKRYCTRCIEEMAVDAVNAREEKPMDKATHIISKYNGTRPDNRATYKAEDLYRADGLLIASRQDDVVRYGTDISTARNHLFLNEECASKFLHRLADVDMLCQRDAVELRERIDMYPSLDQCPRVAVIEERDAGTRELETHDGRKIALAMPGQLHRLKM